MATFKLGDWVQVTPDPDLRSDIWDRKLHSHFCGKIGQINDISEGDQEFDTAINVMVYFDDHRSFGQPGSYSAWFETKHLIKSSKYEYKIAYELKKDFEEYMRIERKTKYLRDKLLKQVFSDPYTEQNKPRPLPENVQREIEEADYGEYYLDYGEYDD